MMRIHCLPSTAIGPAPRPRRRAALLACGGWACGLALPAQAQFGNPGFMTPDTQVPAPARAAPNPSDRLFVLLLGQSSLGEIALAQLAGNKARDPRVKQFAQRMQQAHAQLQQGLGAAAQAVSLSLPTSPSGDQQQWLEQLAALPDGGDFERGCLQIQQLDHQQAVQLLSWEITAGQTPGLQRLAADTLPDTLDHLAAVEALLATLAGITPRTWPRATGA